VSVAKPHGQHRRRQHMLSQTPISISPGAQTAMASYPSISATVHIRNPQTTSNISNHITKIAQACSATDIASNNPPLDSSRTLSRPTNLCSHQNHTTMSFNLFTAVCKSTFSSMTKSPKPELEMACMRAAHRRHGSFSTESTTSDREGRQAVLELRNTRACNYH
jgi:hypothetical protein